MPFLYFLSRTRKGATKSVKSTCMHSHAWREQSSFLRPRACRLKPPLVPWAHSSAFALLFAAVYPALIEGLVLAAADANLPVRPCIVGVRACSRVMRMPLTSLKGGSGENELARGHEMRGVTRKKTVQVLYFVLFSALACQGRFLSLFFRDSLGLSNQQIGYVFGAGHVIGLFSTPAWSFISDFLQKNEEGIMKKILVLSLIIAGGAFSALLFLLPLTTTALTSVGISVFWWTLLIRSLYSFFMSPAIGILDSVSVHSLPNKGDFGQCRLYGTIAWAVVNSAILGPLLHSGAAGWIQPLGFVGFGVLFITGNIDVVKCLW